MARQACIAFGKYFSYYSESCTLGQETTSVLQQSTCTPRSTRRSWARRSTRTTTGACRTTAGRQPQRRRKKNRRKGKKKRRGDGGGESGGRRRWMGRGGEEGCAGRLGHGCEGRRVGGRGEGTSGEGERHERVRGKRGGREGM